LMESALSAVAVAFSARLRPLAEARPLRRFRPFEQARFAKNVEHASLHLFIRKNKRRLAYDQDQVKSVVELVRVQADDLLDHPPQPVPHDRASQLAAGRDAETKPLGPRLGPPVNDELRICERAAVPIDSAKVFSASKAQLPLHLPPSSGSFKTSKADLLLLWTANKEKRPPGVVSYP